MGEPKLHLALFGPFAARVQGKPLGRLRSRKGAWLLALLALRPGRPVERVWLAGTLWPDSDERRALANLRLTLTDLRHALGDEAARLASLTPTTLCLDLDGADVDVLAFDAAIARGDAASLDAAVARYAGPLLADCDEDWALLERAAREQAYLGALESLAAQAAARHDHKAAVRYLRRAVTADPLRESAHRALMEALAALGDHAAVTQTYRDLRLLLHREVNAEPAAETKTLFDRLRLAARDGTVAAAAAVTPSPPRRLPRPISSLVGRREEAQKVARCLGAARLVTLTGTGGVGKTRLAIQVAEDVAPHKPDGVWFVDLAPVADARSIPEATAAALGVRDAPGKRLEEMLEEHLRSRDLLLILDNCEHLIARCAAYAGSLLAACPRLRILATSRQPLGIPGEIAWRVPSLATPDAPSSREPAKDDPAVLLEYDAVRLFVERAASVRPDFALTPGNLRIIGDICRRLDGIPLAVELAAARVRALPVGQILARLDDQFRLLADADRATPARQQTLRGALDWSWDLLSAPERETLMRLCVFSGGCALEAAEAVCAGGLVTWEDVLDRLTALIDRSLVVFEADDEESGRYRLLETIRQYGDEKLKDAGEADAARDRHRDWFLRLAEEAQPKLRGPEQAVYLDKLEREHGNLRAALDRCAAGDSDGVRIGLRLTNALRTFWEIRGHLSEGRAYAARLLACESAPEHPAEYADTLHTAGWLAYVQGEYLAARPLLEQSLSIMERIGAQGRGGVLNDLGLAAIGQGDLVAAREWLEQALALARAADYRSAIANCLNNLAIVANRQGNAAAAVPLLREALAFYRTTGEKHYAINTLMNLGASSIDLGDLDAAAGHYEEVLTLAREIGNTVGAAGGTVGLGEVSLLRGDYARARTLLGEALDLLREVGSKHPQTIALIKLGQAELKDGDHRAAGRSFQSALSLSQESGNRYVLGWILDGVAACAQAAGHSERAARLLGFVVALREATGIRLEPEEDVLAAVRAALPGDTFESLWAEGHAFTPEEAVAYAQQEDS